jgi:hypothetical protein
MNIFDIINIFLFKRKTADSLNLDDDNVLQPFLINRWMSFYSRDVANFVNLTFNKYSTIFEDKNDLFKLYKNLTPQRPFKKINYVKKVKVQKNDEEEKKIKIIASNKMISQREIKQYVDLYKTIVK